MELAEIGPVVNENVNQERPYIDLTYDWQGHRRNYSVDELVQMFNFIDNLKNFNREVESDKFIIPVYPEQLNKMQRFAFEIVKFLFLVHKQLLMMIIGTAGTCKSFTISALTFMLKNQLKKAAPTGKAAFIIRGETAHQLFHLSVSHVQPTNYIPLKDKMLQGLQETFNGALL